MFILFYYIFLTCYSNWLQNLVQKYSFFLKKQTYIVTND